MLAMVSSISVATVLPPDGPPPSLTRPGTPPTDEGRPEDTAEINPDFADEKAVTIQMTAGHAIPSEGVVASTGPSTLVGVSDLSNMGKKETVYHELSTTIMTTENVPAPQQPNKSNSQDINTIILDYHVSDSANVPETVNTALYVEKVDNITQKKETNIGTLQGEIGAVTPLVETSSPKQMITLELVEEVLKPTGGPPVIGPVCDPTMTWHLRKCQCDFQEILTSSGCQTYESGTAVYMQNSALRTVQVSI